ncbi:unnamed protein product [Cladocopium goreaui]|uniref:Nickel/cobalt efflux system n=1 Tax=Cladocopium goreaui TaxID=2562237 RepID=A0A9P1CJB7_9DINO|nr:unnamed protein product [Cladocopium goreaui]
MAARDREALAEGLLGEEKKAASMEELHRQATQVLCGIACVTVLSTCALTVLVPELLTSGLLAYTIGLRHAIDADHIAAIDNIAKRLTTLQKRSAMAGFFFALGHSTVVLLMCIFIAIGRENAWQHLTMKAAGGIVAGGFSGCSLAWRKFSLISQVFVVLFQLRMGRKGRRAEAFFSSWEPALNWRLGTLNSGHPGFQELGPEHDHDERPPRILEGYGEHEHAVAGFFMTCCPSLFTGITASWQMFPVGFLFGLGFDTSSEVALLAMVGLSGDLPHPAYVMVLPLMFLTGMVLVDTLNGLFMAWLYGQSSNSMQRLYFNIVLTGSTAAIALFIGLLEILGVFATWEGLGLHGGFWSWIRLINDDFELVGLMIISFFLTSATLAICCYRRIFPEEGGIEVLLLRAKKTGHPESQMLMLAIIAGGLELQGLLALPRGVAVGRPMADATTSRMTPRDATGLLRKAELRSPRTAVVERPPRPLPVPAVAEAESTLKDLWKMRKEQPKEWFPGRESWTAENLTKAQAQQKTSFKILATHKLKHIRSIHSPRELYSDPPNINMEIGWHLSDDGVLPRLATGATRVSYPKSTCAMTKHQDNMYTTHTQNIIRRG